MDYSSLPNDPDHPVGSSPWQSSPQPTSRQFTASEVSSTPSPPLAKHSPATGDSPQTDRDGSDEEQRLVKISGEYDQSLAGDTLADGETNGHTQTASSNEQVSPVMQQPPQSQQQQQQGRQPQQRAAPNRYHGTAQRNQQRQPLPQYKLRAKITSLERTGRKDPVLRFDVHVSRGRLAIHITVYKSC